MHSLKTCARPYINLAIAADARYLVTWNQRYLTYLMHQDTPEGQDFCRRFPNIKIMDPPTFIRAMQPPAGTEASRAG
jgi:hypothetical protein